MITNFNSQPYDNANTNYNQFEAIYVDGSNCVPISGVNYYSNTFGNVEASFVIDRGDAVLGGNVIVGGDEYITGNLQVGNRIHQLLIGPGVDDSIQFGDINSLKNTTTSAYDNTAIGKDTMSGKTVSGCQNVSVGNYALMNLKSGNNNTGLGHSSLMNSASNDITGNCNTGVGAGSLYSISTGNYNSALGYQSGFDGMTNTFSGNYNTFIGSGASTVSTAGSALNNTTAIGAGSITYQNYQISLGTLSNFVYIPSTTTASLISSPTPWNSPDLGALVVRGGIWGGDNLFVNNGVKCGAITSPTITTINNNITTLQTTTASNSSNITTLQTTTASNSSNITTLQTTTASNSSSITTIQSQLNSGTINPSTISSALTTFNGNITLTGNLKTTTGNVSCSYLTAAGDLQVNGYIKTNNMNTFNYFPPIVTFTSIPANLTTLTSTVNGYTGQLVCTVNVLPYSNNNVTLTMPTYINASCTTNANTNTMYYLSCANQNYTLSVYKGATLWLQKTIKFPTTTNIIFTLPNNTGLSKTGVFGAYTGQISLNFTPDFNNKTDNEIYTVYISVSSILSSTLTVGTGAGTVSFSSLVLNMSSGAYTTPAGGTSTGMMATFAVASSAFQNPSIIAGLTGGIACNDMLIGGKLVIAGTALIPSGNKLGTISGGGLIGSTQRAISIDPVLGTISISQNSIDDINIPTNSYYGIDCSTNNLDVSGQLNVFSNSTIYGDVSLNSRLFVGSDVSFNGNATVSSVFTCNGDTYLNGTIQTAILINDPTAATNYGEGSLVNVGGLGVGGNLYVNGIIGTNSNILTGVIQPTDALAIGYQKTAITSSSATLSNNVWYNTGLYFSTVGGINPYGTYMFEYTVSLSTSATGVNFNYQIGLSTSSTTQVPINIGATGISYISTRYLPSGAHILSLTKIIPIYTSQIYYGLINVGASSGTITMYSGSLIITRIA